MSKQMQRLEPDNKSHSIEVGIQSRVKDPLWLLSRQWQMREFCAENGGHLVKAEIEIKSRPIDKIIKGLKIEETETGDDFDLNTPLEKHVEEEQADSLNTFSTEAWNPSRIEYSFQIKNNDTKLIAEEYNGNDLDWYNFNLLNIGNITENSETIAAIPIPVEFQGMPLPRWWSIEDDRVALGQIKRPNLNYLAMMLLEFSFIYSNDWFVIPVKHKVGHLRKIEKINIIDSFGITSEASPVIDKTPDKQGWEVFTLSPLSSSESCDGRFFYMPNNLYHALESKPYEKVSFLRDEMANLVWAIEQYYQKDGKRINRNDEEIDLKEESNFDPQTQKPSLYWDTKEKILVEIDSIKEEDEPGNRYTGPVALYNPMTEPPANWIPFKPRQLNTEGDYILRRARTQKDVSDGPQYKGIILSESKHLFEDEIQRTGVEVNRFYQIARDTEGKVHCWRSRNKKIDTKRGACGLQFDCLIE